MRVEVKSYYGLARSFDQTEYYETAHHKQLINDIKDAIGEGRMMAVCGVVGSGKTVMMRRLQQMLKDEKSIIVSRALSVEKNRIGLPALISALFYDLSPDKKVQIPRGEARERELLALMKRRRRPVALFIDEASRSQQQYADGAEAVDRNDRRRRYKAVRRAGRASPFT